jgi:hypothetical protein
MRQSGLFGLPGLFVYHVDFADFPSVLRAIGDIVNVEIIFPIIFADFFPNCETTSFRRSTKKDSRPTQAGKKDLKIAILSRFFVFEISFPSNSSPPNPTGRAPNKARSVVSLPLTLSARTNLKNASKTTTYLFQRTRVLVFIVASGKIFSKNLI